MDQVEAVTSDTSSIEAGRELIISGPWSEIGFQGDLSQGTCQGSGGISYRVSVDVVLPAYKCSCSSRKFPCKHVFTLLFPWAQGQVSESGEVVGLASQWAGACEAHAVRKTEPRQRTEEQRVAVAKRATQREGRIIDGLAELDRFLVDQLREGLATHAGERSWRLEHMTARMVGAQVPGVAPRLREPVAQPLLGN